MSEAARRRVLVVDDHPLTRKGLCDAIAAQADLMVCGEAEAWREGLEKARTLRADIVVLDLNLKDGSGWELLKQLQADDAKIPVLVLSVCDENVYAARLLQSGARGYLMKDEPIAHVMEALRKVLDGHIAVSDDMASNLIQVATQGAADTSMDSELGKLSNRELQVLELLHQGLTNKEVGQRMDLSQKTVGTYKARLMEKLGVRTTPELMAWMFTSAAFATGSAPAAAQGETC